MRIDVGLGHVLDEDEGIDDEGVSEEQLQGPLLAGQPVLVVLDTLHVPLLLQNLVQAAAVHSRGWSDGARSSWPLVSTLQDLGGLRIVSLVLSWIHLDFLLVLVKFSM